MLKSLKTLTVIVNEANERLRSSLELLFWPFAFIISFFIKPLKKLVRKVA